MTNRFKRSENCWRARMALFYEFIETALSKWITSIFGWLIALVLANGAIVHLLNILGKGKQPWNEFPMLWRVMDVVLLVFNIVVIVGLTMRLPWSIVVLFIGIIVLQIIPYTVFRSHFVTQPEDHATLNGLIGTEVLLLLVYASLLAWQGNGGGL